MKKQKEIKIIVITLTNKIFGDLFYSLLHFLLQY